MGLWGDRHPEPHVEGPGVRKFEGTLPVDAAK